MRVTDTLQVTLIRYGVDTVAAGFDRPVAAQADDQGLMVAGQPGRVVRLDSSLVLDLTLLIPKDLNFVGGLQNILVANGRLFVYLTTADGLALVAESTASRLDTLLLTGDISVDHFGGGMAWYQDRLIMAFGDGGLGTGRGPGLAGKVVAIDPTTHEQEQLASGLRNPWRVAVDGDTLWIADAGDRLREEINTLDLRSPGAEFGWGIADGTHCYVADCSGVTPPFYSYPTGPGCSTIVGGAVYEGRFWFADYCEGWIRSVGGDGVVYHHLDLDDRIIALTDPIAGKPPFILTAGGLSSARLA